MTEMTAPVPLKPHDTLLLTELINSRGLIFLSYVVKY